MRRLPLLLMLAGLPAAAQPAPSPVGVWATPAGETQVRIARCGDGLCGTVAKVTAGETRDVNNPDPALRSRSVVGTALLSGLKPSEDGWEGSIYNFRDGKTYSGKMALKGPNVLELSGCVLGGLFCKKQVWSRVN